MSRDLARTTGGILETLFGNGQNKPERQHQGELVAMGREQERTVEGIALVNETGREGIREVVMSAMVREQAIQLDPAGAEVYVRMWAETAMDTQAMVHRLARRLA